MVKPARWTPASPDAGRAIIATSYEEKPTTAKPEPSEIEVVPPVADAWGPPRPIQSTHLPPLEALPAAPAAIVVEEIKTAPTPEPLAGSSNSGVFLAPPVALPPDRLPIDLPTVFRLAGANNLQIAMASERVQQAQARLEAAHVLWVPSLQAGVGYNRHDGTIQDTRGDVLKVGRSSVYAGGGPNVGNAPLNGGTNGPARLFLGLPFADAIFEPLARRQETDAASAVHAATFNDALLAATTAYLDLVRAYGEQAIAVESVTNAKELVRLIESRVRAGTTPPADGYRARAELADRQRQQYEAEELLHVTSAELVRQLRLQPGTVLYPLEIQPAPIEIFDQHMTLPDLIVQGLSSRPELAAHQSMVNAAQARLRQEKWRPYLPALQVGYSGGGFGGGRNSFFGDFDGRSDFDALLVWEMRNLGFGNRALRRERLSQNMQAGLAAEQIGDQIAAEVAQSFYRMRYRNQQLEYTRLQVGAASAALPLNFKGILGGELRAIEAQQAIQALVLARRQYLASLTDYNHAQFALLRAVGQPVDASR